MTNPSTYTIEQVRTALPYTVRNYAGQVTEAVNRRGASRDTLEQVVRSLGGSPSTYTRDITEFLANLPNTEGAEATTATEQTDEVAQVRAHAAEVLTQIGEREGLRADMVQRALMEAGLLDPEPTAPEEAEGEGVPSWARSLIEGLESLKTFARRNGWNG